MANWIGRSIGSIDTSQSAPLPPLGSHPQPDLRFHEHASRVIDPLIGRHAPTEKEKFPLERGDLLNITRRYRGSHTHLALHQLATTFIPLAAIYWMGPELLGSAPFLAAFLAVIAAGLVVRAFMLQHDCAHGSFFPSRLANDVVGFLLGVLTLTPHACWRRNHLLHHAGTGNLDMRGVGDIRTMTTLEYRSASRWRQLAYRTYRHPLILFGIGAFLFFLIWQRLTHFFPRDWARERRDVHVTNLVLVGVALSVFVLSSNPWLWIGFHGLVMFLATGIGVWFFYVQHQFPSAYWVKSDQWSFVDAATLGSSFYDLHPVLHWFTAHIGYHHIHHLDTRIPNYRLTTCHRTETKLAAAVHFTLLESLKFSRLKLWDSDRGTMVSFVEAKRDATPSHRGAVQ